MKNWLLKKVRYISDLMEQGRRYTGYQAEDLEPLSDAEWLIILLPVITLMLAIIVLEVV